MQRKAASGDAGGSERRYFTGRAQQSLHSQFGTDNICVGLGAGNLTMTCDGATRSEKSLA